MPRRRYAGFRHSWQELRLSAVIIRSRKGARRGGARSCLARRRKKGSRVTPAVLRGRGAVRGARDARKVRRARPGLALIIIGFEMIKIPWWIRHKSG